MIVSDDHGHNKDSIIVFLDTLLSYLPNEIKIDLQGSCMVKHFQGKIDVSTRWNYFATSHGKGPVDGIGAIVKRIIMQRITTRKFIVQDVDSFLKAADGCIEAVGKTKKEIEAAMKEFDLESIFNNAAKIRDLSNIHVLEVVGDEYRTWKYSGIYLQCYLFDCF